MSLGNSARAYETLQKELSQYDRNNRGFVSENNFKRSLSRFGLQQQQQEQLVQKFSIQPPDSQVLQGDKTPNFVDYSKFLHFFNHIASQKETSKYSRPNQQQHAKILSLPRQDHQNKKQSTTSDGNSSQGNRIHTTEPSLSHSFPDESSTSESSAQHHRSKTPQKKTPSKERHVHFDNSVSSLNRKTTPEDSSWVPTLPVKDLSTLFDKFFALDPKCTGSVSKNDFVSCVKEVIPGENVSKILQGLKKEQMNDSPVKSQHSIDSSKQIDYNRFIKRILDESDSTIPSTPKRNLSTTNDFTPPLHRTSSDNPLNLDADSHREPLQSTPKSPSSTSLARKKVQQLKQLIHHKFETNCNTLKEAFRKLDSDNTGFITSSQFKEGLNKKFNIHVRDLWVQKLFDECDPQHRGVLYFNDLRNALFEPSSTSGASSVSSRRLDESDHVDALLHSSNSVREEDASVDQKTYIPNDFEQNALLSAESDVRKNLSSTTAAGKPTNAYHQSSTSDKEGRRPQTPTSEAEGNRQKREEHRDRMHHESDPFNQDPHLPEKSSSIRPNSLAHISSSDHPLVLNNSQEKSSLRKSASSEFDTRHQYEIARLRKYITEKAYAKTDNLRDLFMYMDTNKDGRLGYEEFRNGLKALGVPPLSENQFTEIAKIADHSGNGFIEYDELCALIENNPRHNSISAVTPLENSARRRKFLTPNLSKERTVTKKNIRNRSTPILPNNQKIYQKILKSMKKNGFYPNFNKKLRSKFQRVDRVSRGSVPRDVVKLALRESGILIGNSEFENLFDELDQSRNDSVPYDSFIENIQKVDSLVRQKQDRAASGWDNFSLSSKQKKALRHTLSLYAHTRREHKDDVREQNEHLIDKKSVVSALNQLNLSLTSQQMQQLLSKSKADTAPDWNASQSSTDLNTPAIFDTNKLMTVLTHQGNLVPEPISTSRTPKFKRRRNLSLTSDDGITPLTPNSHKIQRNDETASPVHLIKQIGDKLRTKANNLHSTFVAFDKSKDGKLSASELKNGLHSMGLDVKPEEVDRLLKHCKISNTRGIDYKEFADIFKASNPSFALDRKTDFVSDIMRKKFGNTSSKPKKTIMLEDQFRNLIKKQNPKTPQWLIDRAVRVSRLPRENGKVDYQKFLSYLQKPNAGGDSTLFAAHNLKAVQSPSVDSNGGGTPVAGRDYEGNDLMDNQLTEKDRSYNPRAKGEYTPINNIVQSNDNITTLPEEDSTIKERNRTPKPRHFSRKMHFERYSSPPLSRYYGYPRTQKELQEEQELSRTQPERFSGSLTPSMTQRNRSFNYFESSLRGGVQSGGPMTAPIRRTASTRRSSVSSEANNPPAQSPLKPTLLFPKPGSLSSPPPNRPHSAGGQVGRRKYPGRRR